MNQYIERDIGQEHTNKLLRAMLLGENDPLPEGVRDMYWRMKAACDRLSCNPNDQLLVMTVMVAGVLPPVSPSSFYEIAKAGKVRAGDAVVVRWGAGMAHGKYVSLAGVDDVVVEIKGEERRVKQSRVSLPETQAV